jgi:hypothetical protein
MADGVPAGFPAGVTAVAAGFGLSGHGVAVIGRNPAGLPYPNLPDLGRVDRLLPAAGVLLVGYTDVILAARAFEPADRGGRLDPNRELLALSAANLGAGFAQGFPVSSNASPHHAGPVRGRSYPGVRAGRGDGRGRGGPVGGRVAQPGGTAPRRRARPGARGGRVHDDASGLTASVGEARIYPTLPAAVAAYHAWCNVHGTGTGTGTGAGTVPQS